jgi:transcriptional regulator with XRE-family HTH domain
MADTPLEFYGSRVRALRLKKGWRIEDLARRSGLSVRAIHNIESGVTTRPRPQSLGWVAKALGVEPEELWRTSPEPGLEAPSIASLPRWVVIARDARGQVINRWSLFQESIRIGRDPKNEVVLTDVHVSHFHAHVAIREGKLEIRDLGSSNGTYVAGVRISQARTIGFGEAVQIRPFVLEFHLSAPPELGPERTYDWAGKTRR